ncbi:Sulfite exporter TauE/SafE family protein [Theileria parva strain Muguga]|uniref:Membrane transporter protein n=1 Tax=Theileria parva TaxID=5875 RepID=Q4N7K3_THEPA|nr:Sulfite exporter TauE/SafE family protein [Theileria parva strain Muguga]EAN34055.1 Sulfite exporter TauE/SafE family protein [Theileria parva strain Muguga]|eukprot:XP_766338.1 hypothetical protein [Theileria parva strain Muguga]
MEFNSTCLYSFLVVCAVSSLSVSIGTGGGLLYVPILGLLYHDVALGVYLSKISILITSFIGTTYHICNDAYLLIKSSKYKSDEESHSDLTPKTVQPPRVYFVLAASLVPSCIVGTNLGTRFHFFAKRHLKILLTSAVAFSMLVTFLKLYLIYKNRKNKLNFQPESKNFETPTIENSNAEVVSKNFISHILEPYSNSSLHTIKMRSISLAIILFCIILYYIAVRFEDSFTPIPILVLLCTIGVYFSIKLRMSFRLSKEYDETTDSDSDEESQVKEKKESKIRKFFEEGIHIILLNTMVAFFSGFMSGAIGIGSGIFLVPLLQYLNVPPLSCSATSNLLTMSMSIATLSRFSFKIDLSREMVIPPVCGSLLGTSLSLFFIRSVIQDKITRLFINVTLLIYCTSSIIVTWAI